MTEDEQRLHKEHVRSGKPAWIGKAAVQTDAKRSACDIGGNLCHNLYPICPAIAASRSRKGHPLMREPLEMATIALVDDDRNILTSVSIALESEGYRVETYTDGASALEGLAARPPNLAILDIKMPRMDGMELLRRMRQKTDLPVIFLTSKDDEIDELFGLKMGADDFIRKPFSQRLLVERVKAVLRSRSPSS